MKIIYFFIFLLCSSILIGSVSLQHYVNNNSYHQWVIDNYDKIKNYVPELKYNNDITNNFILNYTLNNPYNITAIVESDKNNLKYQSILINIFYTCLVIIVLSSVIIYIFRKQLPKFSENKGEDLNIEAVTDAYG